MKRSPLKGVGKNTTMKAKPFLKWAGGKGRLLPQFRSYYPQALQTGEITRYIEPFLGAGAVFLDVAQRFPALQKAYLFDINAQLILAYHVIKESPDALIEALSDLSERYLSRQEPARKEFYYQIRHQYNNGHHHLDDHTQSTARVHAAAQMLFLNKTCYNGLFRVNSKGEFNVPYGKYTHPCLVNPDNLTRVSELLQIAEVRVGDFTASQDVLTDDSFVYFDPPYRPISKTSRFTSYAGQVFGDDDQRRLGNYYRHLAQNSRAKLMLSNSDPQNEKADDYFFDDLYNGFEIKRVNASRAINSNPQKRGQITELLVLNYSR
ncbi:modification methylase [candidate division KSB3 bacterium]|uniref:site-specific DNA-methyltransferase (adenine-specific) n=1 Tax=candidate division KSB3 bacterium TaxID=2044937 RepID=A0A2G6E2C0_9BACT|nr:MAG: modification methylase [candidate division KSB3 bacterium]PIE28789.1 MAG: modification methylase [candidate division KSB3 bacterium]